MARVELDLSNVDERRLLRLQREWKATVRRWWSALAAMETCAVIMREEGKLQQPYEYYTPSQFFTLVGETRDEVRFAERQLMRIDARLRATEGA